MSWIKVHIKGCGGTVGQKLFEDAMKKRMGPRADLSYDWSSGACEIPPGYARLLDALTPRITTPVQQPAEEKPTEEKPPVQQQKLGDCDPTNALQQQSRVEQSQQQQQQQQQQQTSPHRRQLV